MTSNIILTIGFLVCSMFYYGVLFELRDANELIKSYEKQFNVKYEKVGEKICISKN